MIESLTSDIEHREHMLHAKVSLQVTTVNLIFTRNHADGIFGFQIEDLQRRLTQESIERLKIEKAAKVSSVPGLHDCQYQISSSAFWFCFLFVCSESRVDISRANARARVCLASAIPARARCRGRSTAAGRCSCRAEQAVGRAHRAAAGHGRTAQAGMTLGAHVGSHP